MISSVFAKVNSKQSSATNTDDLSIGFDRDRGRRQRELTNNK